MFDLPLRLLIAYGLIAVLLAAMATIVWWLSNNSRESLVARDRARETERFRKRDALAAADRATDIGPPR